MSYYEPQTAKKVYLYRNGTINADAKLLVVNGRQVRDFSAFLNRVTSGIRAPVAVRNIYTPMHGHKVRSLGELQSGRYYVAGGSEQFKKVKYGSGPKLLPRRQQRLEPAAPPLLPAPHVIVAESRYKRPVEKPFVIHVFRNGDELFHGVRVLLPKRVMVSWDHILEIVTEKADLYTPAKKLCTLDGEVVNQLLDGGKYVAVEGSKPFRKVAYCATNITTLRRKRNMTLTLPVVTRRLPKPRGGGWGRPSLPPPPLLSLSNTAPHARPQPPPVDPTAILLVPPQRKVRPMAGRRNKEARERALLENRDDSVFGGSPVMQRHPRMPSPPPSASATNFLLREHMRTNGREPGEGRGRGHVNFHGNNDNDVMNLNPLPLLGGGAHDSNEEGVVTRIVAGEGNFKMGPKTEVTISIQDSDLTPYPPQPPSVAEDSLVEDIADREGEVSTDDLGAKFSTEGNATLERGHTELPEEGVRNEIPNQGVRNQISRKGGSKNGSRRGTPSEGTKIHVPPERVQNNAPPEGAQNSAPTEVGQTTNDNSQTQLLTTDGSIPTSKKESRERKKSGRKLRNNQKQDHQTEGLDKQSGEGGEASISENIPDEIEVEDETKSEVEGGKESPNITGTRQAEPEEVPEEEGVVNRSEVKEETEEPEMKLQGEEVELVSHTPQTTVDLTLTRRHQEPVVNADDRGEESLPRQQTETLMTNSENGDTTGLQTEADGREGGEGERENTAENEGLTPPTQDSQATPPTPPTNDDDEQVLIVE